MKWRSIFHHPTPEDEAQQAEEASVSGARRKLLALAADLGWPASVIRTGRGGEIVIAGQRAWEKHARAWNPATVARAMQRLGTEHAAREHWKALRPENGGTPRVERER